MKTNEINLADYVILQNKLSGEYVSSVSFRNLITINDMQCAKLFSNEMFTDYFLRHYPTFKRSDFNVIPVKIGLEILNKPTEHLYSASYHILKFKTEDKFYSQSQSNTEIITLAKLFRSDQEAEMFLREKGKNREELYTQLPVAIKLYPFTRVER